MTETLKMTQIDQDTVLIDGCIYKRANSISEVVKHRYSIPGSTSPQCIISFSTERLAKEVCQIVERWLPPETSEDNYEPAYARGWNDCLRCLRDGLK